MTQRDRHFATECAPLDLTRPELRRLLERYVDRSILVVGRDDTTRNGIEEGLRARGWSVGTCPGPGRTRCPVLEGKECALRTEADAAVVLVDAGKTWPRSSLLPQLWCAAHGSSPSVVALVGRSHPPAKVNGRGVVGTSRGARGVEEAIGLVLDPDEPPSPDLQAETSGTSFGRPANRRFVPEMDPCEGGQ